MVHILTNENESIPLDEMNSSELNIQSININKEENYGRIDCFLETASILDRIRNKINNIDKLVRNKSNYLFHTEESQQSASGTLSFSHLAAHLRSLRTDYVQRIGKPIIQKLISHSSNSTSVFTYPVDPVALKIPTYCTIIKQPMDLSTIRSRLQEGYYNSLCDLYSDAFLVFDNALLFNPDSNLVHKNAQIMKSELKSEIIQTEEKILKDMEKKANHSCSLCYGSSCALCGEKCLRFESPVLLCHGQCGQRIKKNSVYFISSDGMMQWCQKCYSSLPSVIVELPEDAALLGNLSTNPTSKYSLSENKKLLLKRNLLKRKADEEVAEPWVECDNCGYWVHQICSFYHEQLSKRDNTRSDCPSDNVNMEIDSKDDLLESTDKTVSFQNHLQGSQKFECPLCKLDFGVKRRETSNFDTIDTEKTSPCCTPSHHNGDISLTSRDETVSMLGSFDDISQASRDSSPEPTQRFSNSKHSCSRDSTQLFEVDGLDNTIETFQRKKDADTDSDNSVFMESNDQSPSYPLSCLQEICSESCLPSESTTVTNVWKASSLPTTKLSEFLESMVCNLMRQRGYSEFVPGITIRVVSNRDFKMDVPLSVTEHFMSSVGEKIPEHLGYRQKCILMFQCIDGVDVCLFCLYVHEFDSSCPAPNTSSVYIAYLDSVDYFRPMEARTLVYQEILVAYLKWSQARGFKSGQIWSCPPQRGDNFIFWCHPAHQKTPSRDRLNVWYNSVLARSSAIGCFSHVNNLWESHFSQYSKKDPAVIPQRKAAKNSFVGSGKVSKPSSNKLQRIRHLLRGRKKVEEIEENPLVVTVVPKAEPEPTHIVEKINDTLEGSNFPSVPMCPPVYEGDYWVLECQRTLRHLQTKSKIITDDVASNLRKCRELLKHLLSKNGAASYFGRPVNPIALHIPSYTSIITNPMDLGTIREKLRKLEYKYVLGFAQDVRMTFENALKFNPVGHVVHECAKTLLQTFDILVVQYFISEDLLNNLSDQGKITGASQNVDKILGTFQLTEVKQISPKLNDTKCTNANFFSTPTDSVTSLETLLIKRSFSETECGSSQSMESTIQTEGDERFKLCKTNHLSEEGQMNEYLKPSDLHSYSMTGNSYEQQQQSRNSHTSDGTFATCSQDYSSNDTTESLEALSTWRSSARLQSNSCRSFEAKAFNQSLQCPNFFEARKKEEDVKAAKSTTTTNIDNVTRALVTELSKCVHRYRNDLFTFKFADFKNDCTTLPMAVQSDRNHCTTESTTPNATPSVNFSNGMHRFHRNKASKYLKKLLKGSIKTDEDGTEGNLTANRLSAQSMALLQDMVPDTSDPDPVIICPLMDSRHTFLEMCQFRHYQFDSLRRAKYSSLMILHHLHNPLDKELRPSCTECKAVLQTVRWHCDQCANYDICKACYEKQYAMSLSPRGISDDLSNMEPISPTDKTSIRDETFMAMCGTHPHTLTPFRVTYN